jgi:hypothetical protein
VLLAQTSPDALHVGSVLHVQTAGPAVPPPVQFWCAPHAIGALQTPVESHVCAPPEEQVVSPGTQTPRQAPDTQACITQAAGEPQWPVASHFWTLLPEH